MTRDTSVICFLGSKMIGSDDGKGRPCGLCGRREKIPVWRVELEQMMDGPLYETGATSIMPLCGDCALEAHRQLDDCRCLRTERT